MKTTKIGKNKIGTLGKDGSGQSAVAKAALPKKQAKKNGSHKVQKP